MMYIYISYVEATYSMRPKRKYIVHKYCESDKDDKIAENLLEAIMTHHIMIS